MLRKTLAILLLAATISGGLFAQKRDHNIENKSPEEAAKHMTERMTEKLALTDDQAVAVEKIMFESLTQRKAIEEKYPEMKEAKAEMKAIKKESKAAVKKVLTEEQLAKVKSQKGKNQSQKKEKGQFAKPSVDDKIAKMKANLDLTDDQAKKIRSIMENSEKQRLAVEKKYPDFLTAKAEMKANKTKTASELQKVLTAEQYAEFKKHWKHMPGKGKKNGKGPKGQGPHHQRLN